MNAKNTQRPLSALPRERYRSGLEIGCSIGVLTRQVASRCDRLLSIDVAAIALEQAQERCGDLTNVSFMKACIPSEWPDGSFDILLLSEVLYYLKDCDVASVASRLPATMPAGGDIVLVHWLGETDYPLTGDEAADLFHRRGEGVCGTVRINLSPKTIVSTFCR